MKNEHIVIIFLVAILAASYFGYINLQKGTITTNPSQNYTPGVPYQQPIQQQIPSVETKADAQLYFEVTDAISYSDVATTTEIDVAKATAGVFNFLNLFDTKAQSTNPQAMNSMVSDGSELVIHVASTANPTGGAGYYDGWYYCIAHVGNGIYQLKYADFSAVSASPSYTYSISQTSVATDPIVGYVSWTSGTTPYWNLGKLYIFPRISINSTEAVAYQSTTLASVSNGITWVNITTTMPTANATLASTQETLHFSMYAANANLGYGFPIFVLGSNGAILDYQTYIVFTTGMLAIGAPSGWSPLADSTLYAEKGFYKAIGPYFAPKGQKMSLGIDIPIDSSNAPKSTKYLFRFWIIDCQNPASLPGGSMVTTIPTAYGFIYQYGLSACEQTYAYSTSGGSSATSQLATYLTTPA